MVDHFVPENVSKGTSGVTFRATLTDTSNEYLYDLLPLTGYVRIHEFDIHGYPQPGKVTFCPDRPDGAASPFVEVRNAQFTFGTRS
jgi:hypothetical protein